jgi:amidophosphoribosyltransferase
LEAYNNYCIKGADSGLGEECGVFGIAAPTGVIITPALDAYYGLFALQHRGQESCGIAVKHSGVITCKKDLGLVADVFDKETLRSMTGDAAIGHVRYSTTGNSNLENAQPIAVSHIKGNLAIAHNGNLVNAGTLRHEIEMRGGIFHSTGDSEIIAYTIVQERLKTPSIEDAIRNTMHMIRGAYSLIAMSPRKLIAARDPNGFRPLSIGKLRSSYIFASETCAIEAVGGEYVRDVEPGEIVIIENGKLRSMDSGLEKNPSYCSFEYIYFARRDSIINGVSVEAARRRMGQVLAMESGVDADIVCAVPDSGLSAAAGYAEEAGLPDVAGLVKNRYIGRTFIQPSQSQRERSVRMKLNPLACNVAGKRVVLIDDSIVRGTTSSLIVKSLRDAGATEVHMRISAPPFRYPCFFGTDVPDREKLIAVGRSEKAVAKVIGADSLAYLKHESLSRIMHEFGCETCTACFSGEYPIEVPFEPERLGRKPIINIRSKQ